MRAAYRKRQESATGRRAVVEPNFMMAAARDGQAVSLVSKMVQD